jgi:hypothetical protein
MSEVTNETPAAGADVKAPEADAKASGKAGKAKSGVVEKTVNLAGVGKGEKKLPNGTILTNY